MKTYELSGPDFDLIDLAFAYLTNSPSVGTIAKSDAERLRHQFLAAHDGELHIETDGE